MSDPVLSLSPLSADPPLFTTGNVIAGSAQVLLVFVYIFIVCYRETGDHASGRRRVNTRLALANRPPASKRQSGLSGAAFALLPSVAFREADFKDDLNCGVCLCKLAEGEAARLLPQCGHAFHTVCIDKWFYCHSTCPLCRRAVAIDVPKVAKSGVDVESAESSPTSAHAPDASVGEYSSSSGSFPGRTEEVVIDIPMEAR